MSRLHPDKDPRTAATARGSQVVALGKPTPVHNANPTTLKSTPANDFGKEVSDGKVIFEHPKSGNKLLIAKLDEFKGHRFVNIREWVNGPQGCTPTKKGVSVPLGVMKRLGEALVAFSPSEDAGAPSRAA
jgi:hypothetical protein